MEKLVIAGKEFASRLFLGTGKFGDNETMSKAIAASGTEMVTMAMKRIELGNEDDDMMKHIAKPSSFCQTLLAHAMPKRLCLPPRWHARPLAPTG